MAKKNNKIKTIIAVVSLAVVILGVVGGVIYGFATLEHQVSDNTKLQPEVKQNTEHRIRFEEKVSNIERDVGLILEEVKK
jgi:predicted PurR-regulated permease PerM